MNNINIFCGILLFAFNLNMQSCNRMDVKISGYFKNCISPENTQNDLIVEVDNQSGSTFYINTTNLFYRMKLVGENGDVILPNIRGGAPTESKIILIEGGKHKFVLSLSSLDHYSLKEGYYWIYLTYKNSQRSLKGKSLLVGEIELPRIQMKLCK